MIEMHYKNTKYFTISNIWAQKEKSSKEDAAPDEKTHNGKETHKKDYWERVADDVASGYKNEEDEDNILNIDQVPGDNERGDKATE